MKKMILVLVVLNLWSCNKNSENNLSDYALELKKVESINTVRQKLNDSITIKNKQNVFKALTGEHQLKYSTRESVSFSGKINFQQIGRDLYSVSGSANSGKKNLNIKGEIKRVSDKHLNFEGEISQRINGATDKRTQKTTFFDEGQGNFWRLQSKVNGSGFVDHIDIYF